MTPQPPKTSLWLRIVPRSLRAAVMFAVALGLIVPAAITFVVEQRLSTKNALRNLDKDLERTTEVLALAMRGQLWEFSQANAEAIARGMIDDERFVSVVVIDAVNNRPFMELYRSAGATPLTRTLQRSIRQDGEEIGTVTVTMNVEPYLQVSRVALRWTMLRTALMLSLALFLIVVILHRRLLGPIKALTQAASRLARGDLETAIAPQYDDELGRVAVAMDHMRDELRNAFRTLSAHATQLEDRVAERTEALTTSNRELQEALTTLQTAQRGLIETEKLASLGRVVAGVAHELNTPLGNALTVVTTLEDQWSKFSERVNHEKLRRSDVADIIAATEEGHTILHRNIERASELIRDFKQLAIDQTSDMRRRFDLGKVLQEVLITVQPQFKPTPFKIEQELELGIAMDSFPGPLGQVVTNLLLNSLIHAFEGHPSGVVCITCRRHGETHAQVICADDGKGMLPEVRQKAFEPFFTTRLGRGGSGLGLHIAHNFVTGLLGGTIEIFSAPGHGTEFRITLPLSAPKRSPVHREEERSPSPSA